MNWNKMQTYKRLSRKQIQNIRNEPIFTKENVIKLLKTLKKAIKFKNKTV